MPIGGGGLAAGVAAFIKQVCPQIKVIGVQTDDSCCMKQSVEAGEIVHLKDVGLFSDGTAVKVVGEETFRLCKELLDEIITVNTDMLCGAIKDIFDDTRSITEPAGALALAGLKAYVAKNNIQGQNLVAVTSGANMNFHRLRHVSERSELGEGNEGIFAVTIPEEKEAFSSLSMSWVVGTLPSSTTATATTTMLIFLSACKLPVRKTWPSSANNWLTQVCPMST